VSKFTERILVAVDTPEGSRHVVRVAAELAAALDADLHMVHVRSSRAPVQGRPVTPAQRESMEDEGAGLLEALAQEAERAGRPVVEQHLRIGDRIDRELVALQERLGAGLLVVGVGRQGGTVRQLLAGGGATGTVRRSPGSVLVVRDPA
jgi:nucleotide-binding universal stress UspA family protein